MSSAQVWQFGVKLETVDVLFDPKERELCSVAEGNTLKKTYVNRPAYKDKDRKLELLQNSARATERNIEIYKREIIQRKADPDTDDYNVHDAEKSLRSYEKTLQETNSKIENLKRK